MDYFFEKMDQYSQDLFLIYRNKEYRYCDVKEKVEVWIEKLAALSIRAGDVVSVIGEYSPDIIFCMFALLINKNIIVPLSAESGGQPEKYFSIAKVNYVFKWDDEGYRYEKINQQNSAPLLDKLKDGNESGIIIFSSGSTGECKAAVHQFSKIVKRFLSWKKKPFRSLAFLKIDHIGGLNTILSIFFSGSTLVFSRSRKPGEICRIIEKYKIQLLPTTPSFLNMLIISDAYRRYNLSSLRLITYGTEPMPQSTLDTLLRIFPDIKMKQTYGLTELGIFSTKSMSSNSTWMKIGGEGTNIKIVDNILYIKSESAMLGYLNAVADFTKDGWYNTGDYVEIHGDYIKVICRKKEIINVGGEKVYPHEVENFLMQIENVKEVVVRGRANPIIGQLVTATFVLDQPENPASFQKRVIAYCKGKIADFKVPRVILISEESLVGDRLKKKRCLV